MKKITDTQRKLLEIIRNAIQSGDSFTIRDLQEEMGFSSPRAVAYQLEQLEEMNLIRRKEGRITRVESSDEMGPAVAFLPLLGNAPCGTPFLSEENYEKMIQIPVKLLGRSNHKNLYLVRAVGNSMLPKIESGDYVVFEALSNTENNSIVIARTDDGVTIKKLIKTEDQIILKPLNESYQPLVFDSEENVEVFGKAIGLFKPGFGM